MSDLYCVVGRDVSHSPSPAMMNAAFKSLGMAAIYTAVSVQEAGFQREFRRLTSSRFKGMNVTIVTTAGNDDQARALLKHLGMPFRA